MKKLSLFLLLTTILLGSVYALDCQYTENVYENHTQTIFYEDGLELDYPLLEFTEFTYGSPGNPYWPSGEVGYSFKVKNNHSSKRIELNVTFTKNGNLDSEHFTVDPLGYYIVGRGWNEVIDFNTIQYRFITEDFTAELKEVEVLVGIICKVCNGQTCLNDGSSCQLNIECGSSHCVRKYCSPTVTCYNDDCNCLSNEVQCSDNKTCVEKAVVPLDVKPECNKPQECVTGYIDEETGLCAKSPSQIEEEKQVQEEKEKAEEEQRLKEEQAQKEKERVFFVISIIVFTFILLSGLAIILYLKIIYEEARQKTIQAEIDRENKLLEIENEKLEKINRETEQILKLKKQNEQEIENIKKLKIEKENILLGIEKIKSHINDQWKLIKKFPDKQVNFRWVIINPHLGGYKCFYQTGLPLENYPNDTLVHRWVWKKANGRWPRTGYEIHHKDFDKYNNHISNLEELTPEEHKRKHRMRYS
jgi:hypothetical protein